MTGRTSSVSRLKTGSPAARMACSASAAMAVRSGPSRIFGLGQRPSAAAALARGAGLEAEPVGHGVGDLLAEGLLQRRQSLGLLAGVEGLGGVPGGADPVLDVGIHAGARDSLDEDRDVGGRPAGAAQQPAEQPGGVVAAGPLPLRPVAAEQRGCGQPAGFGQQIGAGDRPADRDPCRSTRRSARRFRWIDSAGTRSARRASAADAQFEQLGQLLVRFGSGRRT